jgi:predicted dehydrogenase
MDWCVRFTGDLKAVIAREWTRSPATGGGYLRQGGSHEFDLARWVTGLEFVRVVGRCAGHRFRLARGDPPEAKGAGDGRGSLSGEGEVICLVG